MTDDLQPYRFAVIPEWIVFHAALNGTSVRVFAALARYADAQQQCWPAASTLGARLNLSADAVRRSLKQLEVVGAIEVTARYDDTGSQRSNLYRLATLTPLVGAAPDTLFGEPPYAEMPEAPLGNPAEGPLAETRNKREPGNERTSSAAVAALPPHAAQAVSPASQLTTNQRANRFMRAYWTWFEEEHGRKPVGLSAVAFAKLVAPFIEAGIPETALGKAVKRMDAAGTPLTRQTIDRELRGARGRQPRDNVSAALAELKFDADGNLL